MNPKRGIVYLVGAGPGDPGLLTLRGAWAIGRADVVVYDHLANARLLDLAPSSALLIRAGKWIGRCTLRQDEINETLLEHAQAGKVVVRLKGGDPLVFGRGAEEAEFLRAHGIPFEFVPGVTAGVGVTAYAGIPLTLRGVSSAVAFVTGHQDPASLSRDDRSRIDWPALARFPGTLVFYMGVTHLDSIRRALIGEGKSPETPTAVVESGTLPNQRVIVGSLSDIVERAKENNARPPALLIVGDVVEQREALAWFESRPLLGQRMVITRPRDEALSAAAPLEELGAEILIAPTVEIHPPDDFGPLDGAIARIAEYHWIVFTSANGVRGFMNRLLLDRTEDIRALGGAKLAAIGPATAETLAEYHLKADLIPPSHRSESLAEALAKVAAGSRILLARADRGRTILQDELGRVAQVDQVTVYRNVDAEAIPESVLKRVEEGSVDWITLTSPAIARRLRALLSEGARARLGRDIKLASISPITTEAATALGWEVAVEASVHSWDGLIQAMLARIQSERAAT